MSDLVTCLCCTYARPQLLGEAIKCFLDQDYENKELIILNDQVGVELFMENCPNNVKIINYPSRFSSLGEKRNYIKTLGNGKYYFIWDDDDLYFKNRISRSVMRMENSCDMVKAEYALMSIHNKDYRIVQNLFHSQACISQEYMAKHEYPCKSVGEDMDFEKGARILSMKGRPIYIYRWGNCGVSEGVHHLSGIADSKKSWEKSLTFLPYQIQGKIEVKPVFQKDYWEEVEEFLRNKKF